MLVSEFIKFYFIKNEGKQYLITRPFAPITKLGSQHGNLFEDFGFHNWLNSISSLLQTRQQPRHPPPSWLASPASVERHVPSSAPWSGPGSPPVPRPLGLSLCSS